MSSRWLSDIEERAFEAYKVFVYSDWIAHVRTEMAREMHIKGKFVWKRICITKFLNYAILWLIIHVNTEITSEMHIWGIFGWKLMYITKYLTYSSG